MSIRHLIFASFRYYWKSHAGLFFGVFLTSAILCGSLLVGDSVRASLRLAASQRLGNVGSGVQGDDRWFTEDLAKDSKTVRMILLRGAVTASGGEIRANGIQILGVENRFWVLSPRGVPFVHGFDANGKSVVVKPGGVGVNEVLAAQLHVKVGDDVLIRLEKPSAISRDAPLSGEANQDITLRRKVTAIISPEDFGSFQLTAAPMSGGTAFLPLADLQAALGRAGHINTLLAPAKDLPDARLSSTITLKPKLEDYALQLTKVSGASPEWQISSDRIFLDEPIAKKLLTQPKAHGVLTYLVNSISSGTASAAYSFVTADMTGPKNEKGPMQHADITQWLADDLSLAPGDSFTIRYFTFGIGRGLLEENAHLRVGKVIHMDDPIVNKSWTPEFPGVSEAENCRDWKPGIPMKLDTIRPKDEAYWKQYRATPKAFISLLSGQALWGNRFGNLTAIRFPDSGQDVNKLREQLVNNLALADIGLSVRNFKAEANAAAQGSVDFGQLFIGLSLFIIAAALVFSVLLFLFTLEKRISQYGLLFALGLRKKSARALLLGETSLIAIIGAALGLWGGELYTKAALYGLNSVWEGATAGMRLIYDEQPISLGIAFGASVLASLGTLAWASRKVFRQKPISLLAGEMGGTNDDAGLAEEPKPSRLGSLFAPLVKLWRWSKPFMPWLLLVLAVALSIAGAKASDPEEIAGMFFTGGFCLLGCGLMLGSRWLASVAKSSKQAETLGAVGFRNVTRRPGRSLAVMGMMAGGIFLVIAVNAFRLSAGGDATQRDSGTGGFSLIGESTLPIYEDLNSETAWDSFALDDKVMKTAKVVPFRVKEGDDASCLNLNKAQQPVLCAVNPKPLADRKAFAFASGNWDALDSKVESKGNEITVPGIADQTTVEWGLSSADSVDYTDGQGKTFHVKIVATLAGSVLQGKIIISEQDFLKMYPDAAGYKFFLVDVTGRPTDAEARAERSSEIRLAKDALAKSEEQRAGHQDANGMDAQAFILKWIELRAEVETVVPPEEPVRFAQAMRQYSKLSADRDYAAVKELLNDEIGRLTTSPVRSWKDFVASNLTRQLEARGLALESTSARLAAYEKVQNTYIGIFTVLGGLGVLLGTAGLGVLAARNILERRGEFGLMLALGFKPGALRRMVLSEHLALLIGGLLLGLLSAAIAVWPDVQQTGGALPWGFLAGLNLGILLFGAFVCWLAASTALRGRPLEALRRE